jgi:acyl carrier protein
VREFIVENYLNGADAELGDRDSLLDGGIVDPMRLPELIEFLEQKYAIAIENDSLIAGSLDSVEGISRFILDRLRATANDAAAGDDDQIVKVNS